MCALLATQPKGDTGSMLPGDLGTLQEWKQLLGSTCARFPAANLSLPPSPNLGSTAVIVPYLNLFTLADCVRREDAGEQQNVNVLSLQRTHTPTRSLTGPDVQALK